MGRSTFIFSFLVACLLSVDLYAQKQGLPAMLDRLKWQVNRKSDTAQLTADSAITLAVKQKDHLLEAKAKTLKGKSLFQHKKTKEAVELYFDALRLCKSPEDDKQIAYIYGEVGYVYFSQQHYKESNQYYLKELALRRRVNGPDSVGDQLINLSVMYQKQQLFDSAESCLKEVASILTRNSNAKLRGYYSLNMGALLERRGALDSATKYYLVAREAWKQSGQNDQLFRVTFNLGYLEYEKKNYREAMKYYNQAKDEAREFGMMPEIAHVYGTMAEAYATLNDYHNAYDHLYRYAEISDSVSKADFNNYIAKLDLQYQTEKKQETIRLQELELQKQKSSKLTIVLVFTIVLFVAIALFGYLTFKRSVQKKVEEAKSKFFANVAHEIRTPLSMINGPVKALQGKIDDPELRYHLDMAERNTERLNELINQMLDVSKMESAQYRLNESVGNIGEFLDGVAQRYDAVAKDKGIRLSTEIDGYAGVALFDKDAVEKIMGNLLGNAIKYTPAGQAAGIHVATTQRENGLTLSIRVWDTGCGIAKAEQEKIFDRFYRAKQGVQSAKGVGIGLSLVKDLVALMGGSIEVESGLGEGAVFSVVLPLKEHVILQNEQSVEGASTILLVEDDADILDFNKTILKQNGYKVVTARNGVQASSVLNELLPDLVVTDVMMPEKDGIALLKEIKANSETDHIPVVVLSAKASVDARIEGVRQGAQAYLPKPFHPGELVGLVRNQLELLEKQRALFKQAAEDKTQAPEQRFAGTDPFTQKCYELIMEHLDDAQLSVEGLAELMNTSRSHFQRKLKTLTGYSPSEMIRMVRLERALKLLQKKEGNITEVAYLTGFTSQSYFTKCFSEHFGYPPSQVTKGQLKAAEVA